MTLFFIILLLYQKKNFCSLHYLGNSEKQSFCFSNECNTHPERNPTMPAPCFTLCKMFLVCHIAITFFHSSIDGFFAQWDHNVLTVKMRCNLSAKCGCSWRIQVSKCQANPTSMAEIYLRLIIFPTIEIIYRGWSSRILNIRTWFERFFNIVLFRCGVFLGVGRMYVTKWKE